MPRRSEPDPFAEEVGRRIRQLREAAGLTLEKLAFESELGSKGHLSSLERGLVRPTVETLRVLAERLRVLPADLLIFPEAGDRETLIDLTRGLPRNRLQGMIRELRKNRTAQPSTVTGARK